MAVIGIGNTSENAAHESAVIGIERKHREPILGPAASTVWQRLVNVNGVDPNFVALTPEAASMVRAQAASRR